jgi:hypothetical protein
MNNLEIFLLVAYLAGGFVLEILPIFDAVYVIRLLRAAGGKFNLAAMLSGLADVSLALCRMVFWPIFQVYYRVSDEAGCQARRIFDQDSDRINRESTKLLQDLERAIAAGDARQTGPMLSELRALRLKFEDRYMEEVQRIVDIWTEKYCG